MACRTAHSQYWNLSVPDNCLICGSSARRVRASYDHPDQYECAVGVPSEDYWREWVCCERCEFHYSRYSRNERVLDQLYEVGYRTKSEWREEGASERFKKIIDLPKSESETHRRIDWIKANLPSSEDREEGGFRLLDVGGASGVFAALFEDSRWRSAVVDPSQEGAFIKEELGIAYTISTLEEADINDRFDLVSLNYVLEHVGDPVEMLRQSKQLLRNDGYLFIEVPDVSNFDTVSHDHDIFNACHLWMFDFNSLSKLLQRADLLVVASEVLTVLRGHRGLMILAGISE